MMRRFLTVAALMVLASGPSWAQGFLQYGSPYPGQSYRIAPFPYFTPPPRANRRASAQPANIKVPQAEKATIDEQYAKGSIVIVNHERKLYFVEDTGQAIRYPVAIGSPVDQWEGVQTITAKRENPTWYPPEDIQWESNVPPVVPPGPQNPLGPRALYLGDTLYRIHGTNRPGSIGGAVSHGCFRMHNTHIVELYEKVQVGANVYVVP
jgi:lipoprotein-anchoring transpeptidase ErfK/SrfK